MNLLLIIKNFFNNHRSALIVAVIVGFLVLMPTLLFFKDIGLANFRGIFPIFNDDEMYYLAMAEDVFDGHWNLGNVFIAEHKNDPFIQPPLAEWLLAGTAKAFNISIPALFMINDFLLPFIGFVFLYLFFFSLAGSKKNAIIFASLFYLLFLNIFNRPINPQFSFILFVAGMIIIWKIFFSDQNEQTNRNWLRNNILLGTVVGALVYIYPFFWTPLVLIYALNIFYTFYINKSIKEILKYSLGFFVPLAIVTTPYLINLAKAVANPFYQETMLRNGMISNHWPACYFNVVLVFLVGIILFLVRNKIAKKQLIFSWILLLSAIILNWQNVITGKYLQFSSHYYWVTVFSVLTIAFIIYNSFCQKLLDLKISFSLYKKILLLALILFLCSSLIYKQRNEIIFGLFPNINKQQELARQKFKEPLDWFNAHSAPESVIYTVGIKDDWLIPIYTKNNLYSYGYAGLNLISDREMEERWIRQNIFFSNVTPDYIKNDYRSIWINKFIDKYQNQQIRNKIFCRLFKKCQTIELLPSTEIDKVFIEYKKIKSQGIVARLKDYRIDYILLDRNYDKASEVEDIIRKKSDFTKAVEIDNYIIYQVR